MGDVLSEPSNVDPRRPARALTERLDGPIEDISLGVSAVLAKFVRQALRGGVQKMDEELSDSVSAKIDEDLKGRGPKLAEEARAAAHGVVEEQLSKLLRSARETAERVNARLDALEAQTIADRSDHQAFVEELESNRVRQAALDDEQTAALSAARAEFAARCVELRAEHASGLAGKGDEFAAALAALDGEQAKALAALDGEQAKALARARADFAAEHQALAAEHAAALARTREEFAAGHAALKHEQAAALTRTREEISAALAEARRRHQAEAAALQGKVEALDRSSSAALADAVTPVAGRLGALEAKVFRPGLLGRLFGKKGPPAEPT